MAHMHAYLVSLSLNPGMCGMCAPVRLRMNSRCRGEMLSRSVSLGTCNTSAYTTQRRGLGAALTAG